jgi:hypothetical protein
VRQRDDGRAWLGHALPCQLTGLYVKGTVTDHPWLHTIVLASGERVEIPAFQRHACNERGNHVAKLRYCEYILKDGLMPELRAPLCPRCESAGRLTKCEGASCRWAILAVSCGEFR